MSTVPGPRRPSGNTGRPAGGSTSEDGSARGGAAAEVPAQRTAADVYRVSEDEVHRARMAVARNAVDSQDCRELLDMLGLLGDAGEPPPVRR